MMGLLYTTNHDNVVMKREPRHRADTVSYMLKGEICKILDRTADYMDNSSMNKRFVHVELEHDGYTGYVLKGQIHEIGQKESDGIPTKLLGMNESDIMLAAQEYMGAPYLWGGRMTTGIDCSGLTQLVYAKLGVNLLRDSYQQVTQGVEVSYDNLQIGDLVFYEDNKGSNKITHVSIYMGPGKTLHVSEYWSADVRFDMLDERGIINPDGTIDNYYVTARRYK